MKRKGGKYLIVLAVVSLCFGVSFTACNDNEALDSFYNYSEDNSASSELSIQEESVSVESVESFSDSSSLMEDESGNGDENEPQDGPGNLLDSSFTEDSSSGEAESEDSSGGLTEGELIPPHVHHLVTEEKAENCTESGYKKVWCDECYSPEVEEYIYYPAWGHTRKTIEPIQPNCYTEGRTEGSYCEVCNEVLVQSQVIPTAPHDYARGLGSCIWCDCSVLEYEIVEYDVIGEGKKCYAICTGPKEFTPHTVVRFVNIPDEITYTEEGITYQCPVMEIEEYAFYEHYEINTVTIGKNVKKIGYHAFGYCFNIREVYDKSDLRIGELNSDQNGGIMQHMKAYDIHYDANYQSKIAIDEDSGCITYTDGAEVELIGIRDVKQRLIIPEGVTKINKYVFYKAHVATQITVAKSVKYIDEYAFACVCKFHADKGHTSWECQGSIKEVIFLNRDGWAVYQYTQKYIALHPEELLPDFDVLWKKLFLTYINMVWIRGE